MSGSVSWPRADLIENGFDVHRNVLSPDELNALRKDVDRIDSRTAGIRNLFDKLASLRRLIGSDSIKAIARGGPVRAILFDKTRTRNWAVAWHQDLLIAVRDKADLPGYRNWTRKQGVWHVQPPREILERMVTLRIHLDDAAKENGALRLVPASHRLGCLKQEDIRRVVDGAQPVTCPTRAGDALAMKPLVVHSSRKCVQEGAGHRRVLQVEFSPDALPAPLRWQLVSENPVSGTGDGGFVRAGAAGSCRGA